MEEDGRHSPHLIDEDNDSDNRAIAQNARKGRIPGRSTSSRLSDRAGYTETRGEIRSQYMKKKIDSL